MRGFLCGGAGGIVFGFSLTLVVGGGGGGPPGLVTGGGGGGPAGLITLLGEDLGHVLVGV